MGQGPEVWNQTDCSRLREAAQCVDGQIAVWLTHGTADNTVPITGQAQSRLLAGSNGCGAASTPVGENGCVEYGCDPNNPVLFAKPTSDIECRRLRATRFGASSLVFRPSAFAAHHDATPLSRHVAIRDEYTQCPFARHM